MFRIRFHGRGGQGVKTASQILSSALFAEGFEVQDAPRYGAERRGAPIFAYVRADRAPIRERGVIETPDLIVVVDETLVGVAAAGVLQGVRPATMLLIASDEAGEAWRARLRLPCMVVTLPASARSAVSCTGAAARLIGRVGRASLERAIRDELEALGSEIAGQSREQALAAYDAFAPHAGAVREGGTEPANAQPDWIDVPLEDAVVSAPDIRAPGTSAASQTGLWRVLRPVIDESLCRLCSWICSTYCPDSAIGVGADGRPRVDYEHCKGCMVCVTVCPPHAIRAVPEAREAA